MTLDLTAQRGTPLSQQRFTWREIAGALPISKLDDDAFTRVRVILMNGIDVGRAALQAHRQPPRRDRCGCRWPRCAASSSTCRR